MWQERPKRFFLNVFVWDFGGPHGSQFSPHGSPTVLWSIPVLPRFFGQSPRFFGQSPRFSHGSLVNPHGSPTVLATTKSLVFRPQIPTVLPRFSVQSPRSPTVLCAAPRFSHGSLCSPNSSPTVLLTRPRFSHGFPTVLAPRQRFSHGSNAHFTVLAHTWPLGRFPESDDHPRFPSAIFYKSELFGKQNPPQDSQHMLNQPRGSFLEFLATGA